MIPLILQGTSTPLSTLGSAATVDALLGTRQALVHWHFPMANGRRADGSLKYIGFSTLADSLWNQGQLLVYTWGTWDLAGKAPFSFADVASGVHDAYLHGFAQAVATWRHPLFIRLDHEMNGTWAPWFGGNDPAGFVAMWRHVVDLFRADGALNATWVWCPNALSADSSSSTHPSKLAALYPGDAYVDWTGFDAYNWATLRGAPWLTFEQLVSGGAGGLADTYGTIAQLAPSKPMLLAEWGCTARGGDKPAWLSSALASIASKYPLIRALTYFQKTDGTADWPLLATDGSAAAYAAGLKAGPYAIAGTFPMPPDSQPIVPLYRALTWGDELARLQSALTAQQQATAEMQSERDTALEARDALQLVITASAAEYEQVRAGLVAERDLAQQIAAAERARGDAAQAQVDDVRAAVRTLAKVAE